MFTSELPVIRKKMEYDLVHNKRIIKKGTQVLILLIGNKKVPVTESSAQYLLATMIYYAESFVIGSCLMDSLKIIYLYQGWFLQQIAGIRYSFNFPDFFFAPG